jgi:formate hydrogenlyase subunit 3/multisubunit Na+/H+ antiporter MnhD subunit
MLLGGTLALFFRDGRRASLCGALGALAGAALGLPPALGALRGRSPAPLALDWSLPFGSFIVGLDALSAFFLVVLLTLCALSAVFGAGYLAGHGAHRRLGPVWFFYGALAASMTLVLVARDAVLFLVAWELMSLASYFLVVFDDEKESVRRAGWTYLVATHLGTAFLLFFFLLLARGAGTTNFYALPGAAGPLAGTAFLLALVGFGTKAGLVPLHVWLPEAHPAAPSHVSSVMSAVMIKTGVYGLLRSLLLLGAPPAWWGWTLLGVGAATACYGALSALAQRDLKRLLAYSSVENVGIIVLGIGLGVLGRAGGHPLVAVLGFGGALLHVLNHALFKGLLFMGAGSVLSAVGTRDMEHMGGLLKRMPWTGAAFLVAAAAACGLPPLNGFVGEFLLYSAAFHAAAREGAAWGPLAIAALALAGALALAAFAKAVGIVFLGEPRGERAAAAREAGWTMRAPLLLLAVFCVLSGHWGALVLYASSGALAQLAGLGPASFVLSMQGTLSTLWYVSAGFSLVVLLALLLALLRERLLSGREVGEGLTWDCGYAAPTARMQYTASSFAEPLTTFFGPLLRVRERAHGPEGFFPAAATFETETPGLFRERVYKPLFEAGLRLALKLRWVQHGRIQLYVLYIALTLLALLVWKLG